MNYLTAEVKAQPLEEKLKNEVLQIVTDKRLLEMLSKDRCSDVCQILASRLRQHNWTVEIVTKTFEDFSFILDGRPTFYHAIIIVSKNQRYFLIDPTIGQFAEIPKANLFIQEITRDLKNQCLAKFKQLSLPDLVFNMIVNTIVLY